MVTTSPMAAKGAMACVMALVFSSEVFREPMIWLRTEASRPRMPTTGVALMVFRPMVTPLMGAMMDWAPLPMEPKEAVRWSTAPM